MTATASPSPVEHGTRLRRPEWIDVVLAAALTGAFLAVAIKIDPEKTSHPFDLAGALLTVFAGGSLAWRRVAPEAVVVMTTGAMAIYAIVDFPGGPVYLSPMIAIY